ncbi:MAG: 23S rRNA (pseudouridine(1915)-N(3))-methyltransferase RlmH [Exilispira sp.]
MPKIIYLISVGKLSNKNIEAIINEYLKRISPFFKIIQYEIKELGLSGKIEIEKEKGKIKNKIMDDSFLIVCDQNGVELNSSELFKSLDQAFELKKSITIIIGGAYGISDDIKKRANLLLSFSKMTFTHQLARLVIIEQIYRYCMNKQGHPFVK